jgi:trehalose/maltose transport system substrate-binding protein
MILPRTVSWAALALVGAAAVMCGCAPESSRGPATATVSVLLPPSERPFWQPIARDFEAAHPGAHVELVEGPQSTDLRESLYTTSLLARDATFDLVYLDVTWTPKFAAAGWLRALDDSFPATDRERFLPSAWDTGIFEGRLYRVPVRTDMGLLFYRQDWLDAEGLKPPATFDQLADEAEQLARMSERGGYVWQGAQYEGLVCNYLEVLSGYGGYWIDPLTNDVGLDDPEAIAAATFLVVCSRNHASPAGVATYQEEESRRIFQDGHAAFLRNWPYAYRLSQQSGSPLAGHVGVILMPASRTGRPTGTLGGWGLGVSRYSQHPDLAIQFIRFATSEESQRALCAPTGYAPALEAAYEDTTLLAANPFLTRFLAFQRHSVSRPGIARYAQASDILQRHLSAALAGIESPQAALERAAFETRLLLGPRHPLKRAEG